MKRTVISAVLLVLVGACGGGGGHSPTEQPQIEQVAGTWQGLWLTSGLSIASIMTLSQNGSSISGTITTLDSTFNITGAASGTGITWSVPNSGCGSLTGTGAGANLAPSELDGGITLDTRGCANGAFFTGTIQWFRGSALKAGGAAKRSTLGDLTRALQERVP
jgi:hypothetical protein